jgi:16S rRNA (adenine1518-N6/adenine1519-N6)-dimethyltransferase
MAPRDERRRPRGRWAAAPRAGAGDRGPKPGHATVRAERPRPRKRFGQHFLTRSDTARRIVDLAEIRPTDTVLEIGPGLGALTRLLLDRTGRLFCVEIDRDLGALFEPHAPVVAVANLPYNISTPVLIKLLERPELFLRLVLMLQLEVAQRICAEPGSKAYGALSVHVQLVARARVAFRVAPAAFAPAPKVESAVVVLEPRDSVVGTPERARLRRVVRTAFSQRRKQLGRSLSRLTPQAGEILAVLGIDPRRRPETLTIDEFVRVTRALDAAS